jgi:hypothetical protein
VIAISRNPSSALLSAVLFATLTSSTWAANSLVFTTPPTNTAAGASIPSIVVTVKDGANTVTTFNGAITLAIANNPATGTLSGVLTVNAQSGVAAFANLSINKAGTNYTLSAASSGITTVNSTQFNITPGAASQLLFTAQPTDTLSNASISPAVKVAIVDDFNNVVTSASTTITLTLEANPGSATLGGTTSITTTNGEATFSNISVGVIELIIRCGPPGRCSALLSAIRLISHTT